MTSERLDSMNESNGIRALGIVGSPRRGGNTDILVDEVLSGAKKAGALVEKVFLNSLNILPCRACDACKNGKDCVQQDDMAELLVKMDQSQVWVLGTPIYWWGPTAQFKAFLDRWYGANHVRFQGRSVILIIPFGGGSEGYASHVLGILNDVISYLGMKLIATVLAPGVHKRGAVREHPQVMDAARQAGRGAVEGNS